MKKIAACACNFLVAFLVVTQVDADNSGAVSETPAQLAARQLIVLYDVTKSGSPSTSAILDAVQNPSATTAATAIYAALGSPSSAMKVLQDTAPALQTILAAQPSSARSRLEQYIVLTYTSAEVAANAAAQLSANPLVLSVQPNGVFTFSATPTDKYFSVDPSAPAYGNYQWGMQALNLQAAWDKERGTAYIAAADNGIDCPYLGASTPCVPHPDLAQNFRWQFSHDFLGGASDFLVDEPLQSPPAKGHGTHVAGIMAATPDFSPLFGNGTSNSGVAGACWTCSLVVLKTGTNFADVVSGITYASDHGIQALNLSLGDGEAPAGPQYTSCADSNFSALCDALLYANQRDMVLVGASGNYFTNRIDFPAQSPYVIAVGGLELSSSGPRFWSHGYGNGNVCTYGTAGSQCGSNWGPQQAVVAPAMDIVSTFYRGSEWNDNVHCGDNFGPGSGSVGYGDCTGTSMAAPHVTGLVGLLRSVNPLVTQDQIKAALTGYATPCTIGDFTDHCGAGIPNAGQAVQGMLGGASVVNRLTPLFSFYSTSGEDHFYTIVPQMALASFTDRGLLPQPPAMGTSITYSPIGSSIPGYSQFPTAFSPPPPAPLATVSVFVSHVNPIAGAGELVPLYRYSWACSSPRTCTHVSHVYTTNPGEYDWIGAGGYLLDGIEGYIYPRTQTQPTGTVKLCRKYDSGRDDYVLFPDDGSNCAAVTDGYTGGDYENPGTLSNWLGWVLPGGQVQPVCAGGIACGSSVVSLVSSQNPSIVGSSVTFTATVLGSSPTGIVAFTDGAVTISGCGAVALTGSGNSRPAACTTSGLTTGGHSIVATYSGDANNSSAVSPVVSQVVNPAGGAINVALASNGGVASASSTLNSGFPIASINNNERAGVNWGTGGGWNDATLDTFPDWVEIDFNGNKTIDHVVVYTLQDNYVSPIEPTDTMTFTTEGVTAFTVQGWDGGTWITLGTVTGNNLVKRTVSFASYTTSRIRINITAALDRYSRLTEVEAWGVAAPDTNVALASAGGVPSASSTYSSSFPVSSINDNERAGVNWGSGGGWNDGTIDAWPDWVQINFNNKKTVDKVILYTVQDNYASPVEPTDTMTFTAQGITDFTVQGWTGSAWTNLASVSSNNLVKRTVILTPYATTRIRITVSGALNHFSRVTELEAWGY